MGTKATTTSMVEVCDAINTKVTQLLALNAAEKQHSPEYATLVGDMKRLQQSLATYSYDEQRALQIVSKIIQKSKKELLELIKSEAGFATKHERAHKLITNIGLYGGYAPITDRVLSALERDTGKLRTLLTEEAQIALAMQKVSDDLGKLMTHLRIAEK